MRGEHSGFEGDFVTGAASRLAAGRVVEARYFWDHADVLAAAGVPPPG